MNPQTHAQLGAVVTGGARGIGRAVGRKLLESGARVSLWDLDPQPLEEAAAAFAESGLNVHTAVVDVSNETDVNRAAQKSVSELGQVDVLVNNAGILGGRGSGLDMPLAAWSRALDVNLTGALLCIRALVPAMRERGWGRVVNMASIAGKEARPDAPHYAASKAGLISLTRSIGQELAASGVLVNAVTPGPAQTDIWAAQDGEHLQHLVDDSIARVPIARLLEVDEVAELTAWLCSNACTYSAGAVFDISGGRAIN